MHGVYRTLLALMVCGPGTVDLKCSRRLVWTALTWRLCEAYVFSVNDGEAAELRSRKDVRIENAPFTVQALLTSRP